MRFKRSRKSRLIYLYFICYCLSELILIALRLWQRFMHQRLVRPYILRALSSSFSIGFFSQHRIVQFLSIVVPYTSSCKRVSVFSFIKSSRKVCPPFKKNLVYSLFQDFDVDEVFCAFEVPKDVDAFLGDPVPHPRTLAPGLPVLHQ